MREPWEYTVTKQVLSSRTFPSGGFDAEGDWRHLYDIYFMNVRTKRGKAGQRPLRPAASVEIRSERRGDRVGLRVAYTAQMGGDRTVTDAVCEANTLLAPVSWTQTFTNELAPGEGLVELTKKGAVKGGKLLVDGREPSVSWPLGAYTADWCLMDTVQRLALKQNTDRHTFDLIEEFSILRGGQMLLHRGASAVSTARGQVPAHVYCHFGEAVIPTVYYVDARTNRLFLVISTRRTIVLREEG